ncbi:response regulator [Sabulicella rubraurantiaca]|uniref:response regulator n=1 Tax=Sabulicella rubraurantiaca TaxID=2811429 RepID=UPI001A96999A|nr:response regulator [Sabulicella rubraurantiaca]
MTGTVLVVDDSAVVCKLARHMLERHGFAVREAEHGGAALQACQEALPDLVLLDRNMPVLDGLGFLRALRAAHGPDRPAVVMCTTEAAQQRILEGLEAGADEYVMKPFDEVILLEKLARVGFAPA